MKVFKFGGASVKDAQAVRNVGEVLSLYHGQNLVVVASAMGKTTNGLEKVVDAYFNATGDAVKRLDEVRRFHYKILEELFPDKEHPVYTEVNESFAEMERAIEDPPTGSYDFEYDQIVSIGEMLSTRIVSAYLNDTGHDNRWFDARDILITDNNYREANLDWEASKSTTEAVLRPYFDEGDSDGKIAITQGFVGVTTENYSTTLGREGSDFTAAALAYLLDAEEVIIWKDVPGVLNADPKWFDETEKLNNISYREAIELAYYGATIIHSKTIKPIQNKKIPLQVRSFISPKESGTLINENTSQDSLIPSFIFRMDQVLISVSPRDFSFIVEENLSDIFGHFADHGVKVNLIQNSAINFSVSVDNNDHVPELIKELQQGYKVLYNDGLELVTIRHYDQQTIERVTLGKEILVEQRSRTTARMVMKDLGLHQEQKQP